MLHHIIWQNTKTLEFLYSVSVPHEIRVIIYICHVVLLNYVLQQRRHEFKVRLIMHPYTKYVYMRRYNQATEEICSTTIANNCVCLSKDCRIFSVWNILHTLPLVCPVWHNHFSKRMFRIFWRSTLLMEAISLATLWMSVQLKKKRG